MFLQQSQLEITSGVSGREVRGAFIAGAFRKLFGRLDCGMLTVRTRAGVLVLDSGKCGPKAEITVQDWRFLRRLCSSSDVGIAESYSRGEWDTPDLRAVMRFAAANGFRAELSTAGGLERASLRLRHWLNRNSRSGSRRNIAAHYDLGNAFYRYWLDGGMNYSSGIFTDSECDLEAAQCEKLDRICALLDVSPGDRVLEIGCGWGGLAEKLVNAHGCRVTGLTLSQEQRDYAAARLSTRTAEGRWDLRLQDYREVTGSFDRIVSVEMLEAVGEAYWPLYFAKLNECLKPGGVAVLQVITIAETKFEAYRRRPDFIQRYIFPGGMLPTKAVIARECEAAGLQLLHQEFFGASYARTLEHWADRFRRSWPDIQKLGFEDRFRRLWNYYLAYCQVGFETEAIDVGLYRIVRPPAPSA